MRKLFAILLLAVMPFAVLAQSGESSAAGAAGATTLVGHYKGDLVGAHSTNQFEVTILKHDGDIIEGTSRFFADERACQGTIPVVGVVAKSKGALTVTLKTKNPVAGCTRIFKLSQVADGVLAGELTGFPKDWQVRLVR